MQLSNDDLLSILKHVGAAAYIILEWWLGRTQKTKAASLIDLGIQGTVAVAKKFEHNYFVLRGKELIMQLTDIENVLSLLCSGVKLGIKIAEDKKISVTDVPMAFDLMTKIGPAFQGIDKVPEELSQLSEADAQALVQFIMKELSLPQGKASDIVQASLKTLSTMPALVAAIRE